tara:strand:+ start:147 stop:743 length:597 start_codon:yes stop_codon:yes gene_type:complete
MKTFNKAAMFGLDARIALAIFGALSVISGAALYSAIQESKIISALAEINEISKATEQIYLDTGSPVQGRGTSTAADINTIYSAIFNKSYSTSGWNGPYLSYPLSSTSTDYVTHPTMSTVRLYTLDSSKSWNQYDNGYCTAGSTCELWLAFDDAGETIAKGLDKRIDVTESNNQGDVRYQLILNKYQFYIKLYPIKNPN